jgi:hypothetical protein
VATDDVRDFSSARIAANYILVNYPGFIVVCHLSLLLCAGALDLNFLPGLRLNRIPQCLNHVFLQRHPSSERTDFSFPLQLRRKLLQAKI